MKMLLLISLIVLSVVFAALAGTAENPENGDKLITVRSQNPEIVTVSDLYSYSGPKCTGTKTTHLVKGDSGDDVHITPYGSKTFYLGQCQSYTISFMYQGKEIEQDVDWAENTIRNSRACFDSDFAGLFAVDYNGSTGDGFLPPLELPQLIAGGAGHIEGGEYDWITFYNTTMTGGMIERDGLGNPISSPLPDGSVVTAVFLYDVVTFEVAQSDDCPAADLTGDCFVDFNDFAIMANQWLTGPGYIPDDMVLVSGGTFEMGDSLGDGSPHELPIHTVTVDSFHIAKYEVTNAQYCDYLNSALSLNLITVTDGVVYQAGSGTNYPHCDTHIADPNSQIDYSAGVFNVRTKSGRDMSYDPIVQVTWYGTVAYCNWRSREEGKEQCYNLSTWECDFGKHGYRLATEAEWEYAARGGLSGRRYPWGDTISHSQANYRSLWYEGSPYYPYDVSPTEGYHPNWNDGVYPYTSPVGSFAANGYGLYDMSGNVCEWCNDWWSPMYYSSSPENEPTGPTWGHSRLLRGGTWADGPTSSRVVDRNEGPPGDRNFCSGFRCVLDLE